MAAPSIPCDSCAHSFVCRLRDNLRGLAAPEVVEYEPGLRLVITRTVECSHHMTSAAVEAHPGALASVPAPAAEVPARIAHDPERIAASHRRGAERAQEARRRNRAQEAGGAASGSAGRRHSPETIAKMRASAAARVARQAAERAATA